MRRDLRNFSAIAVAPLALWLAGCTPGAAGQAGEARAATLGVPVESPAAPRAAEAGPPTTTPSAAPNRITIDNFRFSPATLTVTAGAKVTWTNRDDVPHTATGIARPRAIDSGTLDTDGEYSKVFTTPGVYKYFCAVHPHMTGEV